MTANFLFILEKFVLLGFPFQNVFFAFFSDNINLFKIRLNTLEKKSFLIYLVVQDLTVDPMMMVKITLLKYKIVV